MPFDKMPTHAQWSSAKKGCGADKLVRDQWHIGEHLEKYHQNKNKAGEKYFALKDLKSKFQRYKEALHGKDKAKTCTALVNDIGSLVTKIDNKIKKLEGLFPDLKAYSDSKAQKLSELDDQFNQFVF